MIRGGVYVFAILGYLVVACTVTPCNSEITQSSTTPEKDTQLTSDSQIVNQNDDDDEFVPYQGERISLFDWVLFKTTCERNPGNVLISPISLKLMLILLYEGAQDETARELATALQLPITRAAVREKFFSILKALQTTSRSYSLSIGTRMYVDSSITIRQRYAAVAKTFYDTDVISTNFSDSQQIVRSINDWVSDITNGNIERMIENESDVKESRMIMLNALFFQGFWRRQYFSPEDTHIRTFHTNNEETVKVPFMQAYGRFYYTESAELNANILRIPYHGNKFALYLVLPHTLDGIHRLIKEINSSMTIKYMWLMEDLLVNVTIPKFKFDFSSHLEPILRQLGISHIFDDTATLTGIARSKQTSRNLKVSDILQKAGIEVNENGTTAYGATEVEIGNKIEDQTFLADRPFLFYIEDESIGAILYMGKVMNPLDTANNDVDVPLRQSPAEFGPPVSDPATMLQAGMNAEDRDNLFSTYFSQALCKEHMNGNVVVSPANVRLALTILLEGADGNTNLEIATALRLPEEESLAKEVSQRVLKSLQRNENGTEIAVAARLWVNQNLKVQSSYENTLKQNYHADVETVNFIETKNTADQMKDWIRQVTRNTISAVSMANNLNHDSRLVLSSAVYFKGYWLKAFNKKNTKTQCFYTANSKCVNTSFMRHKSVYRYAYISSISVHVLEIPYSDGKTVMLMLLPKNEKRDPHLRMLTEDLTNVPVSAILANLKPRDLTIILPKFSIESNLNLVPILQRLNIKDVFQTGANLTKMIVDGTARVSNIVQNVKIKVDEEGTLAAANTEVGYESLSGSGNIVQLDRPFLFMIVDTVTKTMLFFGRFVEPV